jgi:hypothetical protein
MTAFTRLKPTSIHMLTEVREEAAGRGQLTKAIGLTEIMHSQTI